MAWMRAPLLLALCLRARSHGRTLQEVNLVPVPEAEAADLKKQEEAQRIVLASDGVWEFIETDMAFNILASVKMGDATKQVTKLIETAAAKWRQEEGVRRAAHQHAPPTNMRRPPTHYPHSALPGCPPCPGCAVPAFPPAGGLPSPPCMLPHVTAM